MWNGALAPTTRKSIGTVKFVPLVEMTARDWEWLDYDNIRNVAQNRLASLIVQGKLIGFFQVNIVEKAAKNEYFWPATQAAHEDFMHTGDSNFFRHEADVEDISDAVEQLERFRANVGTSFLSIPMILAIVAVVAAAAAIRNNLTEEQERQLEEFSAVRLEELDQEHIDLLLASIVTWEYSMEEAEALLDDLPESDEVDEVRDWINDQVAALDDARQTLAAGRGIA